MKDIDKMSMPNCYCIKVGSQEFRVNPKCPRHGKHSPDNHATPKRGSEDEPSEGQAVGSERAKEGES